MQKPPILKGDEAQQLLQLREYLWKLSDVIDKLERRVGDKQTDEGQSEQTVNLPRLAKVATSGSYNDLIDTPDIPDISGKEDKTNKVSAWQEATDDDHYPSEKLVFDSFQQFLFGLQATLDYTTTEASTNTTWIDGKQIYRRTFYSDNPTFISETNSYVVGNIGAYNSVVNFQATAYTRSIPLYNSFYVPFVQGTQVGAVDAMGIGEPDWLTITVWYTKDA